MTDTDDETPTYALPFRPRRNENTVEIIKPERNRSIHVLGETGAGKTEAIKLLAYQFGADAANPVVVFDYKDDYREFFKERGREDDLIRVSLEGSSKVWNVFDEAASDEEFEEIGRILFKGDEENSQNPFFPQAARQVFVALLKSYGDDEEMDNATFAESLRRNPGGGSEPDLLTSTYHLLERKGHSAAAAHLNPDTPKQSGGVFSHLQMKLTELFTGDFAAGDDDGDRETFSIREYMNDPDGEILVLDYPLDRGETVKPVYRFFIDWAIRYGLQNDDTEAFFVLDEFQTIPGLEKVERLVNAGRARGAYAILGLQSVAQLQDTYGEHRAQSILSGLSQEVLLRPGDEPSTSHVRSRLGREHVERDVAEPSETLKREESGEVTERPDVQTLTEEEYPVSEARLQQFGPGEGFVVRQQDWDYGRLYTLDNILERDELEPLLAELKDRRFA